MGAERFLIERGDQMKDATVSLLESLKSDFEKIDFETIFSNNEDMAVQFYQGFEAMVTTLLPFKAMAVAGCFACDEKPSPLSITHGNQQIEMGSMAEIEQSIAEQNDEHPVVNHDMGFLDGIDLSSLTAPDDEDEEGKPDDGGDTE